MNRAPRISLDLLRGFHAAARHLSFTRAAQELFVTQSAISHEIKALEEQIGKPLFERTGRALQLTRAGQELYRAADEALTQLDAAVRRVAGAARTTLTLMTTSALASLWLAPRLPRFNRQHPGIDVQIVTRNDTFDPERDRLDVVIRFVTAGGDTPDMEPLMTCSSFPVCAPSLAADRARPLRTPADLARHVRLDFETIRDGRALSEWDFWYAALGIREILPASTLRFPQLDQVVPAAIAGAGVAMGFVPHLTQQFDDGSLCAPFGKEAIAARGTYFLVVRREVAGDDAVQALEAWLRDEARSEAAQRGAIEAGTRRAARA